MLKQRRLRLYQLLPELLIWKQDRSQISQYFFEVMSNLQVLAIIVSGQFLINLQNKDDGANFLFQKAFQSMATFDLIKLNVSDSWLKFVLVSIWLYFIFLILFISLIYWKYYKARLISNITKIFITYVAQIHHTFLFWIINTFLISKIVHNPFKEGNLLGFNLMYFEGITNIIFITLNSLLGITTALYCYDPLITNNKFSSYNSTFQTMTIIYKMLIGPFFAFLDTRQHLKWIYLSIGIIITGIRYEMLLRTVPYYKYEALRLTANMSGSAFFLCLTNLIMAIIAEAGALAWHDWIYIKIPMIGFCLKLNHSRIHSLIEKNISLPENELHSVSDVLKKLFAVNYSIEKADFKVNFDFRKTHNLAAIYLQTESLYHQESCKLDRCFCKIDLQSSVIKSQKNWIFNSTKANLQYVLGLKIHILNQGVRCLRQNTGLRIILAHSILVQLKNFPKCLFTMFDINKSKASFGEKVSLSFLGNTIQENMTNILNNSASENYQSFDIRKTIDYQEKYAKISSSIEKYISDYIQLWDYYQRPNMILVKFFEKAIILENEAEKLKILWEAYSKNYRNFAKNLAPLYASYLKFLRNSHNTANTVCNLETKLFDHTSKSNEGNEGNEVVLCVSMAKEKLGRILQVSRNVKKELGWSQIELIGSNIKSIQPPYIKESHNQILREYVENSSKTSFNKEAFIQSKEGYLVPVAIYVTIYPAILNEPVYFSIIKERAIENCILIIRSDGFIDSFSKDLAFDLNLEGSKKVHIGEICEDYGVLSMDMSNTKNSISILKKQKTLFDCDRDEDILNYSRNNDTILKFNPLPSAQSKNKNPKFYSVKVQKNLILKDHFYFLFLKSKKLSPETYFVQTIPTRLINNEESPSNKAFSKPLVDTGLPFQNQQTLNNSQQNLDSSRAPQNFILKTNPLSEKTRFIKKINPDAMNFSSQMDESIDIPDERNEIKKSKPAPIENLGNYGHSPPRIKAKEKLQPQRTLQSLSTEATYLKENNFRGKVEEAIYSVPKQTRTKLLDYSMAVFIVVCLGLMVILLILESGHLNVILNHIDSIAAVQKRSSQTSNIYRDTKFITLINKGIISDTRHIALGVQSFSLSRRQILKENAPTLNLLNNQIRNNLNYLSKDQASQFFIGNIGVNDGKNATRKVDGFELITEIANTGNVLSVTIVKSINDNNPSVQFILNNTLNNPILVGDRLAQTLIDDSKSHLYYIQTILMSFSISSAIGVIVVLIILALSVKDFLEKRSKIIELLLRIDEAQLQSCLRKILSFFQMSQQHNLEGFANFKLDLREAGPQLHASPNKEIRMRRAAKKLVKYDSLNTEIKAGVVFTVFCILAFASIFVFSSINYSIAEKGFISKIDKLVQWNEYLIKINLLSAGALEYISTNGSSTMRNIPIKTEIETLLKRVSNIPDFLSSIVSDDGEIESSYLNLMITGNLCELIELPKIPKAVCPALAGGIVTEGLARVISFFVKGFEESIISFSYSNRTVEAAKVALNLKSLITGEQVGMYAGRAYEIFQDVLKEQLKSSMITHKENIIIIFLAYIGVYVLLGCILSLKFWKKIENERENWRKIIRHVPSKIILTSSPFKNYLVKNCDNILNSVKNIL